MSFSLFFYLMHVKAQIPWTNLRPCPGQDAGGFVGRIKEDLVLEEK
jgi:hypothetical protein